MLLAICGASSPEDGLRNTTKRKRLETAQPAEGSPASQKQKSRGVRFAESVKEFDGLRPQHFFLDSVVWEAFSSRLVFPLKSKLYDQPDCVARQFCSSPILGGLTIKLPGHIEDCDLLESDVHVSEMSSQDPQHWPPAGPVGPQVTVALEDGHEVVLRVCRRLSEMYFERFGKFVRIAMRSNKTSMDSEDERNSFSDCTDSVGTYSDSEDTPACSSPYVDVPASQQKEHGEHMNASLDAFNGFVAEVSRLRESLSSLLERLNSAADDDRIPVLPAGGGSSAKVGKVHCTMLRHLHALVQTAVDSLLQGSVTPGAK